jgi:hypothetical protein
LLLQTSRIGAILALLRQWSAPPVVYDIALGLGHFTDDVPFGNVSKRTEPAPRHRSIVTVSTIEADQERRTLQQILSRLSA